MRAVPLGPAGAGARGASKLASLLEVCLNGGLDEGGLAYLLLFGCIKNLLA